MTAHRLLALLAAAALAGAVGSACTSSTGGNGSGTGSPSSSSSGQGFPSPSSAASGGVTNSQSVSVTTSDAPGQTVSASTSSGTPITILGTASHRSYHGTLYATSTVSDCATHSYGAKRIQLFRQAPCRGATRLLFTVDLDGRTVDMSRVMLSIPGTNADPYVNVAPFEKLERSDCGCGVNDLLREGYRVTGFPSRIPPHESFRVYGQDTGVAVFDAWYQSGPTVDQSPALSHLEEDLFLAQIG